MRSGAIEATIPANTEPELGENRCPNGHDSSIPPKLPELPMRREGPPMPFISVGSDMSQTSIVLKASPVIFARRTRVDWFSIARSKTFRASRAFPNILSRASYAD